MKANVFFYYSEETREKIYHELTIFGVEILFDAKIIRELELLEKINDDLDNGIFNPQVGDFMFGYLMDAIRIIVFFENHMKALLIWQGYCVNKINKGIDEYKKLAKKQYEKPIFLDDIPLDPKQEFNLEKKEFFHPAFLETTIGMKELVGSEKYIEKYDLDKDIIEIVKELTKHRNKLHFNPQLHFQISKDKIAKLKKIKSYVADNLGIFCNP